MATTTEAAAHGAAILAGAGTGVWADVPSACRELIQVGEPVEPTPEESAAYDEYHAQYRQPYPALRPFFQEIA